ncbi:MAG: malonyl-CoA decarboxylase family protein [Pseudomonadota bacterium]
MTTIKDLVLTVAGNATLSRWRPNSELSLVELAEQVLSAKGYDQTRGLAAAFWEAYAGSDADAKQQFFSHLTQNLDLDPRRASSALQSYTELPDAERYHTLVQTIEAPRRDLFRRLNQTKEGTRCLVELRADLLKAVKKDITLKRADIDLKSLLTAWFNLGVLELRPLNWGSPAEILEKIIRYEAVHQIDNWRALRQRMEPPDRRCFGYFHPAMPDEPLIFVQVALGTEIPIAIGDVLAEDREICAQDRATVAAFYSISNCQSGLAGISFGNFLIKQVVKFLQVEFEALETFVTLSPIPGLSKWMESASADAKDVFIDVPINQIAAYYLSEMKGSDGQPDDPVARFHLGNGARIHAVHEDADLSEKGQQQSQGAMVNYLYDLKDISKNYEDYTSKTRVARSKAITQLANLAGQKFAKHIQSKQLTA